MKKTIRKHNGTKAAAVLLGILVLAASLVGCAQSSGITETEATAIALERAGVEQADTVSLRVSQEEEDGVPVYAVEFATAERSYTCDVVRGSGEVRNFSYDTASGASALTPQDNSAPANTEAQDSQSAEEKDNSTSDANQSAAAGAVTEEQAKAIALEHAGVAQADVTFHRVKQDRENGRAVYEVEFYAGNAEYDYEIDAETGEILSFDSDIEGWTLESSGTTAAVTQEQARDMVLERIPGATASDVYMERDREDGRDVYEGEAYYDRTEYEFEIDASTGTFIKWSVDYRD